MYVELGEWMPDRQEVGHPGLTVATNVFPIRDGYRSVPDLVSANVGSLDAACRGAYSGRTQQGTNFIAAGTASKLFLTTSGVLTDETGTIQTLSSDGRWEFALYGSQLIATDFSQTGGLQMFDVDLPSSNFGDLSGDAPRAKHITVIGEHVLAGYIQPRGVNVGGIPDQTHEAGIQWCAIGDPTSWPQVGTDAALTVESDWQPLEQEGGAITLMEGSSEWGIVCRERQVWRVDYEGGSRIFAFTKLESDRGCIAHGAGITVGGRVYFPSEEGFLVCDGDRCAAIGYEKIDRWWADNVSLADLTQMSAVHLHEERSILWHHPKSSFQLVYNYEEDRWSNIIASGEWVLAMHPLQQSMDESPWAGADMDTAPEATTNMDTITNASRETAALFDNAHELRSYTGQTFLVGSLETGRREPFEGKRALVRGVRPIHQGSAAVVCGVVGTIKPNDTSAVGAFTVPADNGVCPVRAGGRYFKAAFRTAGMLDHFKGFDANVVRRGRR